MTTFAQLQARGLSFLKAQVGKGYSEVTGQNFGPKPSTAKASPTAPTRRSATS